MRLLFALALLLVAFLLLVRPAWAGEGRCTCRSRKLIAYAENLDPCIL